MRQNSFDVWQVAQFEEHSRQSLPERKVPGLQEIGRQDVDTRLNPTEQVEQDVGRADEHVVQVEWHWEHVDPFQ